MKTTTLSLFSIVALGSCNQSNHVEIITGEAMGTTYRIKIVGHAKNITPTIEKLLAQLDQDLSTWRDDSWVSNFNRAPAGSSFEMPPSVAELLAISKLYSNQTDGLFDPTIGGLIRLWGFGAWRSEWHRNPSDTEISAAREASGFNNLHIEGSQLTKRHSDLMLDFSGIAKGYAVDRIADILQTAGYEDFIIEFGGDLLATGNAPGKQGWTVDGPALNNPINLRNKAIATSGSEHQSRDQLSHVIDPRNGHPVTVGPPVSASATTCAEADALATALLVKASSPP